MTTTGLFGAFHQATDQRLLLEHPYYQRWQEGRLRVEDLAEYAEQYRHFEASLPDVLQAVCSMLPDGSAKQLVEENLNDERTRPRAHVELFESFCEAVGAGDDVGPTRATSDLVSLYTESASSDPVVSLAVIGSYELQAADVAHTKATSLRMFYELDGSGTEFWDVHASIETDHARWTLEALDDLDAPIEKVSRFARKSSDAWWAFLSEREAAALARSGSVSVS
jgi:pyrroloquinoline-quinone synthase